MKKKNHTIVSKCLIYKKNYGKVKYTYKSISKSSKQPLYSKLGQCNHYCKGKCLTQLGKTFF